MAAPSNSQRLVVGFRDDDPRRYRLAGDIGGGVELGRCVDCTHTVYGDPGARKAVIERDTKVACMFCNDNHRHVERVHQSGLISQL